MEESIHGITIKTCTPEFVLTDDHRMLIDFSSGIFAASLGMNNIEIAKAIAMQATQFMHSYQYGTEVKREYLKRLCNFTGFESAYMFSSGTEATEAAWKSARKHTGRPGIWGLEHAFHGKTLGAQIAAGREVDYRNQTVPEKTGCLIFEPYTALTAKRHEKKTIDRINELVEKHNLILIADEIQGGFYRTGKLFGYQHYDIHPDIVCIGKGMCNGFPASAILGPKELIDNPLYELSSTNGGNPMACAAGIAVLDIMESAGFIETLNNNCKLLEEGLSNMKQPSIVNGMVASIWFKSVQDADKAVTDLCEAGLLAIHTKHQTIKLGPVLNMNAATMKEGIKIIKGVLN